MSFKEVFQFFSKWFQIPNRDPYIYEPGVVILLIQVKIQDQIKKNVRLTTGAKND
jgi:hypothetical protein